MRGSKLHKKEQFIKFRQHFYNISGGVKLKQIMKPRSFVRKSWGMAKSPISLSRLTVHVGHQLSTFKFFWLRGYPGVFVALSFWARHCRTHPRPLFSFLGGKTGQENGGGNQERWVCGGAARGLPTSDTLPRRTVSCLIFHPPLSLHENINFFKIMQISLIL